MGVRLGGELELASNVIDLGSRGGVVIEGAATRREDSRELGPVHVGLRRRDVLFGNEVVNRLFLHNC